MPRTPPPGPRSRPARYRVSDAGLFRLDAPLCIVSETRRGHIVLRQHGAVPCTWLGRRLWIDLTLCTLKP
jgi:hypothetical protein